MEERHCHLHTKPRSAVWRLCWRLVVTWEALRVRPLMERTSSCLCPSAQLRPLFCVSGGQAGSDRQQTCVREGTEADQSQVRFLEGSGCLRPRKERNAPWGWLTLHFPWVLPCVLSRSTFVSERIVAALEGIPLQEAGNRRKTV